MEFYRVTITHTPNGQAGHQYPSPTDQGRSGGNQIALPVHIVSNADAYLQYDTMTMATPAGTF